MLSEGRQDAYGHIAFTTKDELEGRFGKGVKVLYNSATNTLAD